MKPLILGLVAMLGFLKWGQAQSARGGGGGDRPEIFMSIKWTCKEGSLFYDPAADSQESAWQTCRNGKLTTGNGKPAPPPMVCKEGSGFYDPAAEGTAPKFFVCRRGKWIPR